MDKWTGDDSESFEEYTKLYSLHGEMTEQQMVDDRLDQYFGNINRFYRKDPSERD